MSSQTGLWIDHRHAIIVTMTPTGTALQKIPSNVETQARREGDSPLAGDYEALQVAPENRHLRAVTGHLNAYYDRVLACISDAKSVLILGPGEAKGELQKRMESAGKSDRVVRVETADKMTDHQIEAKVRAHFAHGR